MEVFVKLFSDHVVNVSQAEVVVDKNVSDSVELLMYQGPSCAVCERSMYVCPNDALLVSYRALTQAIETVTGVSGFSVHRGHICTV